MNFLVLITTNVEQHSCQDYYYYYYNLSKGRQEPLHEKIAEMETQFINDFLLQRRRKSFFRKMSFGKGRTQINDKV